MANSPALILSDFSAQPYPVSPFRSALSGLTFPLSLIRSHLSAPTLPLEKTVFPKTNFKIATVPLFYNQRAANYGNACIALLPDKRRGAANQIVAGHQKCGTLKT